MTDERPVEIHLGPQPGRFPWFRDMALCFLTVAIAALVVLVVDQQKQITRLNDTLVRNSALRTAQLAELNTQLEDLQGQLGIAQDQSAEKDARIRQLTDQLLRAGLQPTPAPTVRASTAVTPTPVPGPSPSPSPAPTVPASPSPSPAPSPSASPSGGPPCLVTLLGRCIVPA